eukprot:TRINITY_DN3618_c7_g1_i1.p3 TRINITY_DN3618_c7_g1~~TRINITY_DN3618_c7_g1_i1.p3  ORF type:complete len:104 (+),score=24.29 TRINITY_DN3618_c7_g1_i1:91-402(+)
MLPGTSTIHWSPSEAALNRKSFNAMVQHKKLDVTEVMVTDGTMGQAVMMGEGWQPSAIVARQIAKSLTEPKSAQGGQQQVLVKRQIGASKPLLTGANAVVHKP